MERKYESNERALEVAKEAVWLAWQACGGTLGLGILQNKPGATSAEVWERAYRDGRVDADYVFGRMMKLYFKVDDLAIRYSDSVPRIDYQGWCGAYPTYTALFDAAEEATKRDTKAA